MIHKLFIMPDGTVEAFDYQAEHLPQFEGAIQTVLVSLLVAAGFTDEATEFNYIDQQGGLAQLTGAQIAAGVEKVKDRQG